MLLLKLLFLTIWGYTVTATTGTVVVSSGNTLKVHASPSSSSSTLYSLSNGAVVTLTCYTKGEIISGSQGTTDQWDQVNANGYASHAYISSSGSVPSCSGGCTGKVVVASGATLKVHSSPSTSSSTLYSLANSAVAALTCVTTGDAVSGSQGTTSAWYQISSSGYASAAYMSSTCSPAACSSPPPSTNSTFQLALDYGMRNIGTIYVGCAAGNYRFGVVAPSDMYHDGTTCGQSRVYFQPKGSVGFDCSGLMVQMFGAAGIYLPYQSSSSIKANVPAVSKSSIRKGDMLAKNGHVVMWIGNGQVMESTPYAQKGDTSWTGTRVNGDSSYMNSADYTAHRYPGLN